MTENNQVLELQHTSRTYGNGKQRFTALETCQLLGRFFRSTVLSAEQHRQEYSGSEIDHKDRA